jgi:hypothetical protein
MTENNLIKLDQRLYELIEKGGKPSSAFGRPVDSRGSRPEDLYQT